MYRKCLFVFALVLFACLNALAQPAISRGQQQLTTTHDDCLKRGQDAYKAEGWSNIGTSGNAVAAFKGIHAAYIVCHPADGNMVVNIFVASTANDSGVPGAERTKLQNRMNGDTPPPKPSPGTNIPTKKP